ncbi:MAG: hypothetical protein OIF47_08590 [Marinibacterium sp.]|nr:hypothetical protein [Marinibacterium sp.]
MRHAVIHHLTHRLRYRRTWGSRIGRDCVDLDRSLCRWLGDRMMFLSRHTNTCPIGDAPYPDDLPATDRLMHWRALLGQHGAALQGYASDGSGRDAAVQALRFVANHLGQLWD